MRNIRLTVEYDGTNYHGWQSQINAITVQDKLEEAISGLTGETISVTGSSRTDYGVHALGQVVNFFTGSAIPADKFSYALNSRLPYDIVIKSSEEVPLQFHSRYSATGKKYIYKIYNSTFPSALLRNRAFHVSRPLDVMKMKAAAEHLLGRHDFSTFMSTGSSVKTTVRTISKVSLELEDGLIILGIEGDGFLYNMVRIIAGTLVEIGFGKINAEDMPGIIAGLDRKKAGRTAPPQGLYLVEVFYGDGSAIL